MTFYPLYWSGLNFPGFSLRKFRENLNTISIRRFLFFLKTSISISLVFGLIACADKPSSPPKGKLNEVGFSHLNLSTHQLNETKVIDITSSVVLNLQGPSKFNNHSLIKSDCFNTYLKFFSGSSRIENSWKLLVKDILPPKSFTPTSNPQSELSCDFKIEVFSQEQMIALILLRGIRIKNIENYSNFPLPLEMENLTAKQEQNQENPHLYVQKKDIENLELVIPPDQGKVLTLCDGSKKSHFFSEQVLPMSDFFSEDLFHEKDLSLCRLVAYRENPSKVWVSDSFFIQGKEPQISYQYQNNYKVEIWKRVHWAQESMGILNLSNRGNSVIYLQIPELSTSVSVAGVYSYHSSDINYRSKILNLNAWWIVDDGVLFKKGNSKTPSVYRLEPGRSMSLSLNTHDGFSCINEKYIVVGQKFQTMPPLGNGELPAHREFNCRGFYSLSGILYHLHEFPEIKYNVFSTMDYEKWEPLSGLDQLHSPQYEEGFSHWSPNYQVPSHCLKEILENFPTKSINRNLMECSL